MLIVLFGLLIVNLLLLLKLMYWVNTIKKYQYLNNLKLVGTLKRETALARCKIGNRGSYDLRNQRREDGKYQ